VYASLRRVALLVCLSPAIARAQHDAHGAGAHAAPRLGTVSFPNSGARAAQAPFLRGLALLHSFEYDDAAIAFREAERADPSFAVAYWLEALTYSHILWREDDPESARRALARLAPTSAERLAKASTPRERAYGAAVEAFYADTSVAARVLAFADSTRALAERYADDLEASAFASVAAMMAEQAGNLPPARERLETERATRFAERVFAASPNHPGAAHYLIHVADMDAAFAPRALPAARAYDKIAPDAEHALHMPSHVFLKLGLWDDDAASNERAWAASRRWAAAHGLTGADAGFHELIFLQHAYLQQGRWRAAHALIDTARALVAGADLSSAEHVDARYIVPQLEFMYAAETGRWAEARVEPPPASTAPSVAAARAASFDRTMRYARDVTTAMRGDTAAAIAAMRTLGGVPDSARAAKLPPFAVLYALTMDALAARARGDAAGAAARLREAGPYEDRVPLIAPPMFVSTHELLGATLLAAGDARGAAEAYQRSLAHQPNRSAALLGLARARTASGDRAGAAEAYRKLLANWAHADADLPALDEARRGGR
jgi:tetratricopeptide (TPR) repeat protein